MTRLFVAIVPPRPAVAALELAAAAGRDESFRWVPPDRWHLTLEFLGDSDAEVASRRWAQRTRDPAPMSLHLAGAGAFPNGRHGRVLWVGLAGDVVAWQHLAADDQQPHLTIARSRRPADMTAAVMALAGHEGPA